MVLKDLEPIDATYIKLIPNIVYTDCFESSLLRYIHIIFGNPKYHTVDIQKLEKFGAKPNILKFFKTYNTIHIQNKYYTKKQGMIERTEWCKLLNSVKSFSFVHDNYEIKSCLENIHVFINKFITLYQPKHPVDRKIENDIECSIYPKCKGKKILITDTIFFTDRYKWILTQFFEPISKIRITGHSQIYNF